MPDRRLPLIAIACVALGVVLGFVLGWRVRPLPSARETNADVATVSPSAVETVKNISVLAKPIAAASSSMPNMAM